MSLIAAIDVGTTTARVRLFDESGEVVAAESQRVGLSLPGPGLVEQDPMELVELPLALLKVALSGLGAVAGDLTSMGLVTQRGGVVAWDGSTGMPLAPMIGWQDTRTIDRVEELKALGLPLNTQASCTKFEWATTNSPEVAAARDAGTLRLGTLDSWLTWQLTGGSAFVTDPSNAGATGLYDPGTGSWLEMGMDLFGQDSAWHPEIVGTSEVVGETPVGIVGAAVPVAARAGDQQAACFAEAVSEPGDAKLTLGTSAMLDVCSGSTPPVDTPTGTYGLPLWRLHGSDGTVELHCTEASAATAGASIEWLVRVGLLGNVADLDAVAAEASDSHCLMVPALAGLGAPHSDEQARGAIVGIELGTSTADLVAGAVEGVAHRCAELIETLSVSDSVRANGGLANSTRLLQRIADLSGLEVIASRDLEATARGAAMFAAIAPGVDAGPLPMPEPGVALVPSTSSDERAESIERFDAAVAGARAAVQGANSPAD